MYAYLGERWVDGGYFEHRITMPLGMPASVEAWFHLGFGSLYTFCVRESTPSERAEVLRFQDESGR